MPPSRPDVVVSLLNCLVFMSLKTRGTGIIFLSFTTFWAFWYVKHTIPKYESHNVHYWGHGPVRPTRLCVSKLLPAVRRAYPFFLSLKWYSGAFDGSEHQQTYPTTINHLRCATTESMPGSPRHVRVDRNVLSCPRLRLC